MKSFAEEKIKCDTKIGISEKFGKKEDAGYQNCFQVLLSLDHYNLLL